MSTAKVLRGRIGRMMRSLMEKLTRQEINRFTELCPTVLTLFEAVLNSVFDEQGGRWTDFKLRIGGAMSAVELARNSRLQPRRAMWHASMVLMTLRDGSLEGNDGYDLLANIAAVAHTLSLTSIACDSEVASSESVDQARTFIQAMGPGELGWEKLLAAHRATLPDDAGGRRGKALR